MATRRTKGAKGVYLDLPPDLAEALDREAKASERTFREVCERRLRSADPPIPGPAGVEAVPRKAGRPRKEVEPGGHLGMSQQE